MTANQSRLLGVALLLAAISAVMYLARLNDAFDGAADRRAAQEAVAHRQQVEQELARSRARLERGAYVLNAKRISDSEEIQTILIPEGHSEELDTRCVVYKNTELHTSSIACTGILFSRATPPS